MIGWMVDGSIGSVETREDAIFGLHSPLSLPVHTIHLIITSDYLIISSHELIFVSICMCLSISLYVSISVYLCVVRVWMTRY